MVNGKSTQCTEHSVIFCDLNDGLHTVMFFDESNVQTHIIHIDGDKVFCKSLPHQTFDQETIFVIDRTMPAITEQCVKSIKCDGSEYEIKVFGDDFCEIFIKKDGILLNSCQIDKKIKNIVTNTHTLDNVKIAIFLAQIDDDTSFAVVCGDDLIFSGLCRDINLIDDSLKILIDLHDDFHHGMVYDYRATDGSVRLADEYSVYLSDDKVVISEFHLIHFMQCIRAKNLKLARQKLSPELNSMLDDNHLVEYFGTFDTAEINKYTKVVNPNVIVTKYKNKLQSKFTFTMQNNIIINIDRK